MKEVYTAEYGAGGPSAAEGKPAWPNVVRGLVAGAYKAPVTTTCQIACESKCPATEGTVIAARRLADDGADDRQLTLTIAPTPAPTGDTKAPTPKPTAVPTVAPTPIPTAAPTAVPTP